MAARGHSLIGENLAPLAEGLVGRDEQGSAFIALRFGCVSCLIASTSRRKNGLGDWCQVCALRREPHLHIALLCL